jgi:hypothetical protein
LEYVKWLQVGVRVLIPSRTTAAEQTYHLSLDKGVSLIPSPVICSSDKMMFLPLAYDVLKVRERERKEACKSKFGS